MFGTAVHFHLSLIFSRKDTSLPLEWSPVRVGSKYKTWVEVNKNPLIYFGKRSKISYFIFPVKSRLHTHLLIKSSPILFDLLLIQAFFISFSFNEPLPFVYKYCVLCFNKSVLKWTYCQLFSEKPNCTKLSLFLIYAGGFWTEQRYT